MNCRHNLLFILTLLAGIYGAEAQQPVLPDNQVIQVEGKGLLTKQTNPTARATQVQIYTAGGFINVHTGKITEGYKLNYYVHFSNRNAIDTTKSVFADKKLRSYKTIGQIYMNVDDELQIDLKDDKTGIVVKKYKIKRIKVTPEIRLYHSTKEREEPIEVHSLNGHAAKLTLPPDEKVNIRFAKPNGFAEADIEYTIINLKTNRAEYKTSHSGLTPFNLVANTDYELRYNYLIQPDSAATLYIQVKPYWYQSFLACILLIVGAAVSIILIIMFVSKRRVVASQNEQQKMEQAALRLQSQLNPHFTFNALSSIQGMMNTGRIDEANDYLQEFSFLLRKTLSKSEQVYNSLDQELEMMRTYIRLEAIRFNFLWNIEIDEALFPSVIEIPTLLLQPLIENAIRHGLAVLRNKGQLHIICKQKSNTLIMIVKDNGTWFDKPSTSGYGLTLTKERIRTINKLHKDRFIELTFDKTSGTKAVLTFHHWI